MLSARDLLKVARARRARARYSFKIAGEARRADLPLDLAYALVEQESGFRNIFGCDYGPGRAFCHQEVTATRVAQLTSRPFVVEANRLGGAHRPRIQLRVGFRVLKDSMRTHGYTVGLQRYNGTGLAAVRYAELLKAKRARWHRILNP